MKKMNKYGEKTNGEYNNVAALIKMVNFEKEVS